ncbi:MAG: protoheme IX farnesyltransferase [Dehalococcoidia bacterium]|nr:MAG: protoheme IX farnesyltransferase [Dehalococcoidia bacterium]
MVEVTKTTRCTAVHEASVPPQTKGIIDYITVLKPRETVLLVFIGICSAVVAGQGSVPWDILLLALAALTTGSAGANGITNYLDRHVDARMRRTHMRSLPAERIVPARRALVWSLFLVIVALVLAWFLHPLAFLFGLTGTVAASVFRKKVMCVIQGGIAGCAPVLIGYVAVTHQLDLTILFICILIAVWIPLHVWSVMIANREDYIQAGVVYFPVTWKPKDAIKVLLALSVLLYAASLALWDVGGFGWLYFAIANVLGVFMVYATYNLLRSGTSEDAWKVYKLSAFPYLGVIFTVLCLNFWI